MFILTSVLGHQSTNNKLIKLFSNYKYIYTIRVAQNFHFTLYHYSTPLLNVFKGIGYQNYQFPSSWIKFYSHNLVRWSPLYSLIWPLTIVPLVGKLNSDLFCLLTCPCFEKMDRIDPDVTKNVCCI